MKLNNRSLKNNVIFSISLAGMTWFTLAIKLYMSLGSISNFFSYFTVLTNLLIAVTLTFSSIIPKSRVGIFCSQLSVQTAIALYIFVVSLVYNAVLRHLGNFTGWQFFTDNMVHVVIPILYILFWLFFRTKGILKWQDGLYWILFPLLYLIYCLIRGAIVHWYPYPFLNVFKLGYSKVLQNVVIMVGVFLSAGTILIFITKSIKGKEEILSKN